MRGLLLVVLQSAPISSGTTSPASRPQSCRGQDQKLVVEPSARHIPASHSPTPFWGCSQVPCAHPCQRGNFTSLRGRQPPGLQQGCCLCREVQAQASVSTAKTFFPLPPLCCSCPQSSVPPPCILSCHQEWGGEGQDREAGLVVAWPGCSQAHNGPAEVWVYSMGEQPSSSSNSLHRRVLGWCGSRQLTGSARPSCSLTSCSALGCNTSTTKPRSMQHWRIAEACTRLARTTTSEHNDPNSATQPHRPSSHPPADLGVEEALWNALTVCHRQLESEPIILPFLVAGM